MSATGALFPAGEGAAIFRHGFPSKGANLKCSSPENFAECVNRCLTASGEFELPDNLFGNAVFMQPGSEFTLLYHQGSFAFSESCRTFHEAIARGLRICARRGVWGIRVEHGSGQLLADRFDLSALEPALRLVHSAKVQVNSAQANSAQANSTKDEGDVLVQEEIMFRSQLS